MTIRGDPTKQIGKTICEALGLGAFKVIGIDIHLHVGEVATINVEYYPHDEIQGIAPILKHYKLELIDE